MALEAALLVVMVGLPFLQVFLAQKFRMVAVVLVALMELITMAQIIYLLQVLIQAHREH